MTSKKSGRFLRTNRLTKPSDYKKVFNSTFRSADNNFLVLCKRNGLSSARLGLVVAKKNIPLAVARNRIKRLVRENFRHNKHKVKGLDLVVITQKSISGDSNILRQSLQQHWEKSTKCKSS